MTDSMTSPKPVGSRAAARTAPVSRRWLALASVLVTLVAAVLAVVVDVSRSSEAATIVPVDTFERVHAAGGWGTASGGATWTAAAGGRYQSVDGHQGVMSLAPARFSRATLGLSPVRDSDVSLSMRLSRLPGGTGMYVGLFSRLSASGEYRATARVHSDGTVSALIYRLGSSMTIVGTERTIPGLRMTAGSTVLLRMVTLGVAPTRLSLTVWASGTTRPAPQVMATDAALELQKAGALGVTASLSGRSTVSVAAAFPGFSGTVLDQPAAPAPAPVAPAPVQSPSASPTPTPTPTETAAPVSSAPPCTGTDVAAGQDVAAIVNAAPAGSTVCIGSGVFRLTKTLAPRQGVTIAGTGGTVLDGSVDLTGWVRDGSGWYVAGVLPAAYTNKGQCEDNVTNPCLVSEQVFSDGARLRRVMSLGALAAGTFFQDFAANRTYVGSDPSGHDLVMSRTRTAITSSASDVTVRDLTVQRFASIGQSGAVLANGPRWTLLRDVFRDNHALGALLSQADGSVVQDSLFTANGQLGLGQHDSQNVVVRGNTFTGNNTEGFWISDWESGGYKATKSSVLFTDNTVTKNLGVGVWLDVDCKGVTVQDSTITGNAADGIRFEISYDGVIRRNTITGNGLGLGRGGGTSIYATAGINSNTSSNVDIYGNVVSGNMNAIGLQARARGTGLYGLRVLENNTVHDNTITMTSGSAYGQGATGLVENVSDTSYFTSKGNTFTGNSYVVDSLSAKRFAWNGTYVTASTWKSFGNDTSGSVAVG